MFSARNDAKAIIKITKYCRGTVYNVVKRLKTVQDIGHTPCGPHRDKKQTPTFLAGLKRSIEANPALSVMVHTSRRSVSRRTNARAIKNDLNMSSYIRVR